MNPLRRLREHVIGPAASAAADLCCVAVSAALAYMVAASASLVVGGSFSGPGKVFDERWPALVVVSLALVWWFMSKGHYRQRSPFWEEARTVAAACAFAFGAEGFLVFALKADGSRLAIFLTWALAPFAVMIGRSALRFMAGPSSLARVLVVGDGGHREAACRAVESDPYMGYRVVARSGLESHDEIFSTAMEVAATHVVVALTGRDERELPLAATLRARGLSVILCPLVTGFPASGMAVQYVMGQEAILLVDRFQIAPATSYAAKRAFDLVFALAALAAAALPMLIIALLVKRDGGPAIYGHERIGAGGRTFRCLKFRSMAIDAEERLESLLASDGEVEREWESTRKLKADPRVTWIGKFLRQTALDELPQLVNVVRGEMSLVGPRPVTDEEIGMYGESVGLYSSVRPGVTGLWQVSGRNDVSYEERVALDAWYVQNWSLWHDLAIIMKTVPALLTKRGAY